MDGENPTQFRAFQMYKSMRYPRSIKACLESNGIELKKYSSWAKWSKKFNWKERAEAYDKAVSEEIQKSLIAESVERKRRHIEYLNEFDKLIGERLKTLKADDLDAELTMDLLERSSHLDSEIVGVKQEDSSSSFAIRFVDDFKDI